MRERRVSKIKLIEAMKEARESHISWERYQKKRKRPVPHVGDAKWHRRWVKIYDGVLEWMEK